MEVSYMPFSIMGSIKAFDYPLILRDVYLNNYGVLSTPPHITHSNHYYRVNSFY
jgi:hypothetical protein